MFTCRAAVMLGGVSEHAYLISMAISITLFRNFPSWEEKQGENKHTFATSGSSFPLCNISYGTAAWCPRQCTGSPTRTCWTLFKSKKKKDRHFLKLKSDCRLFLLQNTWVLSWGAPWGFWGRVTGDWFGKRGLVLGCWKTCTTPTRQKYG